LAVYRKKDGKQKGEDRTLELTVSHGDPIRLLGRRTLRELSATSWGPLINVLIDQAIINYNQEGVSDKKQSHYALIISSQLAAEQTHLAGGDQADSTARLQQDVALKFMKQAWQAPGVQSPFNLVIL
jgi:hypothetical protein